MGYPYVQGAYGFKPYNLIGGRVEAGSTRMYPIQSAYGTNMYFGDVVQLNTAATFGTVITSSMSTSTTSTGVAGTLGVFLGCEYSSSGGPIYGKNRYQYWPAATVAQDALAYIADDPQQVFRTVVLQQPQTTLSNTVTAVGYLNPYYVGSNLSIVTDTPGTTAPSFSTGDSNMGVSGAAPTATSNAGAGARVTTALPWRMVGVVPDTALTFTAVGGTNGASTATVTLAANANTYGPTIPGQTAAVGIVPGMQVICTTGASPTRVNVSNYATVIAANTTTLTLDSAVTIAGTGATGQTLTIVGYPEVLVMWNFGYHGYFNATGA